MNQAEIQKMGERELDAAITDWLREDGDNRRCPACGWPYAKDAAHGCIPANCSMRPVPKHGRWRFCASLDACHAAEERLKEMGLLPRWVEAMFVVIDPDPSATSATDALAQIAHASARQRAEAILMAVQEGEAP